MASLQAFPFPLLPRALIPFPFPFERLPRRLHINLIFIYTLTALVSEIILLVLRHSLVRFRPHLLMYKYHVLSMKYFVDVTLFILK